MCSVEGLLQKLESHGVELIICRPYRGWITLTVQDAMECSNLGPTPSLPDALAFR